MTIPRTSDKFSINILVHKMKGKPRSKERYLPVYLPKYGLIITTY